MLMIIKELQKIGTLETDNIVGPSDIFA